MPIKLANNASGTIATAISTTDTGIVLTSGNGALFPSLAAGEYFYATLASSGGTLEIVKVTARSGDSLTVVRAQEGTTAAGFASGARFELRVTAQSVRDAIDDVDAAAVDFTPYGSISSTNVQSAIQEIVDEVNILSTNTFTVEVITATAAQTVFNLSNPYVVGSVNLSVYMNGLRIRNVVDYVETNSTRVTLTSGAQAGDELTFVAGREVNDGLAASSVSFTPAGSGAIARTAQEKMRDTVSVKDFGAVGDGVADDTAAIQAALNSVVQDSGAFDLQFESRGGTVNIPAGRYLVSSTLTIKPGTCIIGDGPNISVIVNSGTTNNVLYATDTQGGSVDPLLIENLAVVQKLGITHTAGNAIHIDAATYGISPVIRNVRTQDTYGGVYLDWCYPSTLENVQAMRHTAFGFRARRNCTSTLFQNCYAGAITTGSGFLLAGNYMSLVGCASDNNPSGYGYEFDFDGGLTTGVSMLGCGSEGCNGAVYADRVAGLSIVSPRLIIKSGGTHGIQLLGTTSATVVAPVISCLAANANYAIYQASSGGISASATTLVATPSLFTNYTNSFNDTDNVWSFGRQSLYGALWNDRFRLGDATHDAAGISRFHFGGDFPSGSGGVAYGENFRIEATAAYTVAASVNYQPVVNAPALTLSRLIAGPIVTTPTITAGTVTRLEGARFSDIAGGGANVNLALGNGVIPSGLNYSICNTSTRENLQAGPTRWSSSTGPLDTFGTGSPESVVAAPVGSTYRRTDGGAGTSFYVKESGTGNTGWVAK